MPEEFDNDEIEDEDETPEGLRAAAKRSKAHKAEADKAKRELAFLKAGIDTESKIGKLLMASYDGDLTKDAIKAYTADLPGFAPEGGTEESEEGASDEERQSTSERNELANNSAGDTTSGKPDPRRESEKVAKDALDAGATEEEALAEQFQVLVGAAQDGDQRVIVR